jgi:hypothetical protein
MEAKLEVKFVPSVQLCKPSHNNNDVAIVKTVELQSFGLDCGSIRITSIIWGSKQATETEP